VLPQQCKDLEAINIPHPVTVSFKFTDLINMVDVLIGLDGLTLG
jgi:hypothetical protein